MFSWIRTSKLFVIVAAIPVTVTATASKRYPNNWLQRKESTEVAQTDENCTCRLPNGANLGKVHVYKDVICERTDKKRINFDIDGDHKYVSLQFKLNLNQSVINDIHKFHWIQFIRRHKTDRNGEEPQECMNTSPGVYHYRKEWYVNVPRTRDVNKQTMFYDKYGLHNTSKDELSIFVNPKSWFDPWRENELLIELESYLVAEINANQNKFCVLFRVHCEKQYNAKHPKGHFINIQSEASNYMIHPMQSDQKWIVGYTIFGVMDEEHSVLIDNLCLTEADSLLMR